MNYVFLHWDLTPCLFLLRINHPMPSVMYTVFALMIEWKLWCMHFSGQCLLLIIDNFFLTLCFREWTKKFQVTYCIIQLLHFSLFSYRILLRQEVMFYLRSSLPPGESFQKTIRPKLLLPSWFPWKPPDFTLQTTWKRKNLLFPQMRISVSGIFIFITWLVTYYGG